MKYNSLTVASRWLMPYLGAALGVAYELTDEKTYFLFCPVLGLTILNSRNIRLGLETTLFIAPRRLGDLFAVSPALIVIVKLQGEIP